MNCDCATTFSVKLCGPDMYKQFKRALDRGRHPAFVGRDTMTSNASQGGALLYVWRGEIVAVSLINPKYGVLLALNVHPKHRGHGLGKAVMKFLIPNFVRALESSVPWFEGLGYISVGKMKKGISLNTQVMARSELFRLAGNLRKAFDSTDISEKTND